MAIVKVTESNFEQEVLLLVFEKGKVVKQSIGYIEKDEVMALIQ